MNRAALRDLTVATLTEPRVAAARLIGLGLGRDILWQALLLAVVLNALAFWLGVLAVPSGQELPPMMATPFMFALTMGCGAVVTVFAITFVGTWLGGAAQLDEILVLVAWLQALRLVVQVIATVLTVSLPGLALLLLMAVNIYGLWIFVNFIDVAHRFGSLLKAFGVILMAGFGIVIGLVLMLSIIGTTTMGVSAHV